MKVLVLGRSGQVATELLRRAPDSVRVEALGREAVDFMEPDRLRAAVRATDADAVVNAVAYTAVDKAESDAETAFAVNATAVEALASACAERGLPLVHISTDYVFPGSGERPWTPDDAPAPLGVYGKSKLAGEAAIRREHPERHAILRTSWVVSAHGANFVKTMLRLGADRDRLTIVADQIGGPTPAAAIADACFAIAAQLLDDHSKSGTYHFSGCPDTSWADFAREIFARSGLTPEVVDIPTSGYPTPARRPLNSRLDCSATERTFGLARPDWKAHLTDILKELAAP